MKFSKLDEIVISRANELRVSARYGGEWGDGGCASLLNRLNNYKNILVVKLDLRPSEFHKLNDIEVGSPTEFSDIIERYKIKLAQNIKL